METASGTPSGFAFVDQGGFRTTTSSASSPGVIQRFDPTQSASVGKPTRMVEAAVLPSLAAASSSTTGGSGSSGGSSGVTFPPDSGSGTGVGQYFVRAVAPLYDRSAVVALTVSGFTVLPWNYDAAVAPPKITAVVNAADGKLPVAPGGLISVYGQQMAPVNIATSELPLPTALGESCLTVNGVAVPVLFVSGQQINGQLPFNVDGNAQMTLRTPGGISDNFNFSILPAAPSIFRTGSSGTDTGLATITRADNGEFVTLTNPVHPGDSIVIWATGLGRTSPPIDSGMPAPASPLPSAVIQPTVQIGGVSLDIQYAGLVPGSVGLYQINASVPKSVPTGMTMPLVVTQGGSSTSLDVRVVK
jgi:uncharacterized protein (TIGR03437 family)